MERTVRCRRGSALAAGDVVGAVKCDFCSRPDPTWTHPAESFNDGIGGRSIDAWLACDQCNALIAAGDLEGLVRRALRDNADGRIRALAYDAWAINYARNLYRGFWRARKGTPQRVAA